MAEKSAPSFFEGDEWEICNDDGFVFRRRRRLLRPAADSEDPAPPAPQQSEAEQRRHRRERRRSCLLALKEKYQRELDQWESLSASLLHLSQPRCGATASADGAASPAAPSSPPPWPAASAAPEAGSSTRLVDELLAQAEAHEAILARASEICGHVELLCKEQEEALVESVIQLPIWGSPRSILRSLQE